MCLTLFKHFGMVLVDFLRMPSLTKKNIKTIFSFDDDTIELLNSCDGGIIMTGHLGSWEMFIPGFGLNDFPMSIITQTQKNKDGDKFFNWIRNKENTNLIPKKKSKEIMRQVLDDNKFLGLASDQNAGKYGIEVPFFNSMVSSSRSWMDSANRLASSVAAGMRPAVSTTTRGWDNSARRFSSSVSSQPSSK